MEASTSLSVIERSSRQKISKIIDNLNNTINQLNLIAIFKILYSTIAEYTFCSSSHGTFPKIDHILFHKMHLNKFKTIEITQNIFSEHNRIKLEIENRKVAAVFLYIWKLSTVLNNTCYKKKVLKKSKKNFGLNKNETVLSKFLYATNNI